MKKILAVIFTVFSLYSVFADDGGSYYPEEWTYGNIYVKEPNDKIALERELLFVGQVCPTNFVFFFVPSPGGRVRVGAYLIPYSIPSLIP